MAHDPPSPVASAAGQGADRGAGSGALAATPEASAAPASGVTIGTYVPAELAAAFDALLVDETRSKALRRLVKDAIERGASARGHERPFTPGPAVKRVVVSLSADEAARLAIAARVRSTNAANWLRTLMRRRLGVAARQESDLRGPIGALTMEVRAIGRNLNQAVKALNLVMADGRRDAAVADLYRVVEIARELKGLDARLREIALGDYRYWLRASE